MKQFKLHTAKYMPELREFAEKAAVDAIYINKTCGNGDKPYAVFFAVARFDLFCEMLLNLLLDIAAGENAMYKQSERLTEMARSLRQTPLYGREMRRLKRFLCAGRTLNLEGYVTFRMAEFQEKLDLMVYSLVKKIKFGN